MTIRLLLAVLHLLGLGLGLGAILWRAIGLRGPVDQARLGQVFIADTLWGIAAAVWIITGLLRAFAGFEKGTDYYVSSDAFMLKMGLLIIIIALEIWPMVTLIRWRKAARNNTLSDTSSAATISTISWVQSVLVVLMVFAASAMARGLGVELW